MKTKEQIEKEIDRLRKKLNDDSMEVIKGILIFERVHALTWVLRDNDED